nr:reverse transcriptase domain-containing protein [Tanacetum cinerariifolium]
NPRSRCRTRLRKEKSQFHKTEAGCVCEYCDKSYNQLLPIIAEKFNEDKERNKRLKGVKARLNFGGSSGTTRYSESRTMSTREHEKRHRSRRSRSPRPSPSVFSRIRRGRSRSPKQKLREKVRGVFKTLGDKERVCPYAQIITTSAPTRDVRKRSQKVRTAEVGIGKQNQRKRDLVWRKKTCPSRGSEDPEDHLKIFQAAAKTERWAMPTWCHMFNSTLTGNARKKYIKVPIELHKIKQRDGESTKDFVRRYKLESRYVKGVPKCMRILGFVHGITNPELIKRLHDKIPKIVDEMMRVTTSFLRGEVAGSNHERKKLFPSWKQQEEKGKFKTPPPMKTPVEKQNHAKNFEFHGEVGHNADECMHLKKQIEEMLKAGKLSHLIKELKQNNENEHSKTSKKGETQGKEKPLAILMVQPWERVARQQITQSFSLNPEIFFPPLGEDEGIERPMIIEAEIGGHYIHLIYVDGESASEILYEHCFNRLRPEIKNQLVPAIILLIGFSGELIWTIGQIQLLVKIRDEEHSVSAWMNFVVVRSPSPYNGIIGTPGVRKLQVVASTAHGMLKIPVEGGIITLKSSMLVPLECAMVSGPEKNPSATKPIVEERVDPADVTGIPRHIADHCLNVRERCSPVRQKKRWQAVDRNQTIQKEVGKLIELKDVRRFQRLKQSMPKRWLSATINRLEGGIPVRIPFQMLPGRIQRLSSNTNGKKGRRKNSVHHKQRNLEVYVDDLVIKSRTKDDIVKDIDKTFKTLREINMKLNLKKCTFGVEEGMFLGYKVNTKGIKVCLDKVDDVLSLPSPKCLKDVQKLNGKLASLNRFLAKSATKSLPFFKTLKKCTKKSDFHWTMEAEEAFKQIKQLIVELPMLTVPMEKEELIVYLAAAKEMVLSRPEVAGRLQKLSIELGEYVIHYRPRVSVTRQILADFIAEQLKEDSSDILMEAKEELPEPWILFTDGFGAGLILTNLKRVEFTYALRFRFDTTNNEAEYEALIVGLRIAEQMGIDNLYANVDSRLVANKVNGTYVSKEVEMIRYLEKVRTLTNSFKVFSIRQIPRSENKKADALSKIASTSFAHLSKQVLVEELKEKSISEVEILAVVEEEEMSR